MLKYNEDEHADVTKHFHYIFNNEKVGEFYAFEKTSDLIFIYALKINENRRRLGHGTRMLNELIEMAKHKNYKTISLIVEKTNKIAIKMYNKAGFKSYGWRYSSFLDMELHF